MKLYYSPGACSLSPHIALNEAGIAFEPVMASTKTHALPDGTSFYDINPLGYVPVLELDDGTRLREGPVIVQYIADLAPTKNLAPAHGTLARYRLQEWLTFINGELHKQFSPLFSGGTDDVKEAARAKIAKRLAFVEESLGDKPYLSGTQFSVADGYLFVVLSWVKGLKLDVGALPQLDAFYDRVAARPAVQQTLATEREAKKGAMQA